MPQRPKRHRCQFKGCKRLASLGKPTCLLHDYLLDEELDDELDDESEQAAALDMLLASLIERPEVQGIIGKFTSILDRAAGFVDRKPTEPPPPQKMSNNLDPYKVMGFARGTKLTKELVSQRRKDLARIFHSDLGGNEEAMREVNEAADALIKELK